MPAPGDQSANSPDAHAPESAPLAPAPERGSRLSRVAPVVFILGALGAAIAVALGAGAVALPGSGSAEASAQQAAAAKQMAANQRWTSTTCTTVLGWKNEIQRDMHGLTISLSAIPRVEDAIGATTRAVDSINKLGVPPALQNAAGRSELDQIRSDFQSHVKGIESAASSVAGGNLGAIVTLLSDLGNVPSTGSQIVGHLREVAPELGISLASSPSCRQLVGVKL